MKSTEMKSTITNDVIEIRHYSTKELAKLYGVCDKTLLKWMKRFEKEIGPKEGRYFTIAQVKIIFEKIGWPGRND